ncbi:MAG: polysaccharide biosynthesis C-terminal domain-containing protein [Clostridia bacterium]|nr:polysaccharide biosynthesis C-terminal domain-containing protein [Clostridia bacterium]
MNKYKRLLSDTFIFAVSNFSSKLLNFFLLPLYTNVLTTKEYGVADLLTNTINLVYPILTLAISEATLRFAFDKDVKKNQIISVTLLLSFLGTGILGLCGVFVKHLSETMWQYWIYFLLLYTSYNLQYCFAQYTRGCKKTRLYALQGIFQTITIIIFNIFALLVLKKGLYGYLDALILSNIAATIFMIILGKYWNEIIHFEINFKLMKDMIIYSLPIIPSLIAWWANNAADRYIIIAKLGMASSGVYSVAYKIPSILTVVTTIFTQAWQISAISNYEDKDAAHFFTNVYKYFNIASVLSCSILIIFSNLLAKILFAKDYYIAWKYVPVLLIAFVFSGLSAFLSSIFTSSKKTNVLFVSTCIGAAMNIGLNFVFIDLFGAMGAAYMTMISFLIVWIIRYYMANKIMTIKVNIFKSVVSYALLMAQAVVVSHEISFFLGAGLLLLIVAVNFYEIRYLISKLLQYVSRFMKNKGTYIN